MKMTMNDKHRAGVKKSCQSPIYAGGKRDFQHKQIALFLGIELMLHDEQKLKVTSWHPPVDATTAKIIRKMH
jgi:hypothetical protein